MQWLLVVAGTVASIPLVERLVPTPQDIKTLSQWMTLAREGGLLSVYDWPQTVVFERFHNFGPNYPPLVFYVYFPLYSLLAKAGVLVAWPSHGATLLFRLPLYLVQLASAVVVSNRAGTSRRGPNPAWLWFGLNPVLFLLGPLWGQFDVLLWLLMLVSLRALVDDDAFVVSALFAALAAITKPQFLLFVPILALAMQRRPVRRQLVWTAAFAAFTLLLTLPFTLAHRFSWLIHGYERIVHGDDVLTSTAYNAWWLISRVVANNSIDQTILGVSPAILGAAMTAACALPAFLRYRRVGGSLVPIASLYSVAVYAFLPGMSARMLVYGLLWSLLWAVDERRVRVPVLALMSLQVLGLMHNALWTAESRFAFFISSQTAAVIAVIASLSLIGVYSWLLVMYLGGVECRILAGRYRESHAPLPAVLPSSA